MSDAAISNGRAGGGDRGATRAPRWLRVAFAVIAAMFVFTACFHLAAAIHRSLDPEAPAWRHLLFVGINLTCVAGLLRRPFVFIPAFLVLLVQQIATHGSHMLRLYREQGTIDWPSIAVLFVMPLSMSLLLYDAHLRLKARV